jgi:tRNA pseudouridine13 synthase
MKLKRLPEDFRVEEIPAVETSDRGRFTFYRLWKRGVGTFEALEAVRRRWNIPAERISYGGLKDRHAETIQYLTIVEGPKRTLREENLELVPIGALPHPYGPRFFRGNRFDLVIRDLGSETAERAVRAVATMDRDGLPNYFDDQRFGSVGITGDFIGEAWLKGNHEEAFRLAVAEPTKSDRPDAKAEKEILRGFWNRWPEAKERLPRSHARSLVTYLVDHPTDFRGAFARIRRELRSIYFAAYQSHLWNLALGGLIEAHTRPDQRVNIAFTTATLPLHHDLDTVQARILGGRTIPLPTTRTPVENLGENRESLLKVVADRGLEWNQLRIKHLKDVFFSKGERPALFHPTGTQWKIDADELYLKRRKLLLGFELPRGAYATLVVKRCTRLADPTVEDVEIEADDDPDPV